jgi:Ser/Thr protein kinase RdoA (MazF antagonist)
MRVYHGDPAKLALPGPTTSAELLAFVAREYGLDTCAARDLGGSFNLNLLVNGHVVRMYGPWVSARRLQELQRIRQTLGQRGFSVPVLRPARNGSLWQAFCDSVLEVERYVPGDPMVSPTQLQTGMQTLGRLHAHLADIELHAPPPIANYLPQELAVDATLDAIAVVHSWGATPREQRFAVIAEALARQLPIADLPTQLVHGDFKDNNVLFRDGQLVAILDFDFAGARPRVDDLALPLGHLLQTGTSVAEIRCLLDAYDAGSLNPLSKEERSALPFAMARMALSFLQYLVLPADIDLMRRLRREFNEVRGPVCEWWLNTLRRELPRF